MSEDNEVPRDIQLVIVTGAGASSKMGTKPFPLMSEWSESLRKHLLNEVPMFADLVGLAADIEGAEFERRLGQFLRESIDYSSAEDLVLRSFELPFVSGILNSYVIAEWRLQFSNGLDRLITEIYQSTFKEFGRNNEFLSQRAETSYSELLNVIGIRPDESVWALATTNYDHIAEITLNRLGFHTFVGEERSAGSGSMFRLNGKRLAQFASPYGTPILHLHGSVGWFQDRRGQNYGYDSVGTYDSSMGIPIMLLPDLSKDYRSSRLIVDIWNEFHTVLRRAHSVLVLGHSLNDEELCFALADGIDDGRRIAISQYNATAMSELEELQWCTKLQQEYLPTFIPMEFGEPFNSATVAAMHSWQDAVESIN